MYTRSYSRDNGVRTPLPPDYGGTALVINSPDKEGQGHADQSAITAPERAVPRRRERRAESIPRNDEDSVRDGRRELEKKRDEEQKKEPDTLISPFGGLGQTLSHSVADKKHEGLFHGLFSPDNIRSDDLLLLGLMFLMYSEGLEKEGCKEAMLLLAVIYLSGI